MTVSKEELAAKVDVADWQMLRAHLERGGLIFVDGMLDLVEVGVGVAADDVKSIERWIVSGLIGKPAAPQIEQWDAEQGKRFLCLIVSPYVLIQEESPGKG
ncbi:MAG: hypothetical protein A2075_02060 [Geobacteraceae bacterium GWC2_58_44]|nr:MAG: hypothetical protein A2075_02060 [Geobacteraceae bacterium GWC2_58_44]HBG06415.1 DUF2288 domain-containing protein [Geobacter sp.]